MFITIFTVKKSHRFNQRSKILKIYIFMLLKEKLSYDLQQIFKVFFTILVTPVAPQFFLHPHFSQFII